jgi:hypothetical protein
MVNSPDSGFFMITRCTALSGAVLGLKGNESVELRLSALKLAGEKRCHGDTPCQR